MITIDKEKPEHNIFEYYWPAYIRMRSQKYQIVDDSDSVFAQLQGNEYLILKPIDEKLKYSLTTILGEIQATRELFLYLLSIDDNKE